MRKEFQLTEEQLNRLLEAAKPTLVMLIGGVAPAGPQENANSAWQLLAKELGFVWDTAKPVSGKDMYYFTAEVVL